MFQLPIFRNGVPNAASLTEILRNTAVLASVALVAVLIPYLLIVASHATPGQAGFSVAAWLGVEPALTIGTFLGIITASFIYLLTTWFAMRDRSQVYLMLMLLCLMSYMAVGSGYLDRFAMNPLVILFMRQASLILFYLFSTIFTIIYLELDAIRLPIRHVLYAVTGLLALTLLMAAIDIQFVRGFMPYVGLIVLFFLVVAGLNAVLLRVGGSLAHVAAFGVVFLGTLADIALNWREGFSAPGSGDIRAIAYALCSMLFAVVIASQFARRQEMKERELATSNERFRMAALGSNEGLFDLDFLRKENYFSDRFRRILGVNLATQKSPVKAWLSLIHSEDRMRFRRTLASFRRDKTRNTLTLDARINRPDRKTVWISTTGVAVRNEAGRIVRLVGSVGDVTEKKRAEMRLRTSEMRFRSITEAHPVPVLIATLHEGEIVFASPGCQAALQLPVENLQGRTLGDFFDNGDILRELLLEVQQKGRLDLKEVVIKRADNTRFPAAISARPIHYERRPCAVFGLYDISERKTAEARVKETEAALQQSEKLAALGGLLAGVAHELNNPLSVIVGQAALLKESAPEPKILQRADKIRTAGERCSRIVRSFLALARRKPTERKPVAINTLIEESLELVAFQLRTDNIELRRKLDATLPAALADSDQMIQVITNLVINAKQVLAERPAPRIIEVETWHRDAEGGNEATVYVAVSDNGTGVPKEIVHRIFEPFFTTKPAGAGTGVGLSLCHSVIETHGGRIWVEDAVGGGARFVFTLPVSNKAFARDNMEAMVEGAPAKAPPMRILVVDDEVELAQTLCDILTPDGHQTAIADNGKRALEMLKERDYDLVISDLRMPVMDGPTLYRTLEKTMPRYMQRILFVTGDTLSLPVREFLHSYSLDVIEKPYSPEEVRRAIAIYLRDNKRRHRGKGEEARAPLS
ncbi:MAG: response regulator [Proteobacteria bacterium]|nr:response regulator [Pseudomonadota bacterium]